MVFNLDSSPSGCWHCQLESRASADDVIPCSFVTIGMVMLSELEWIEMPTYSFACCLPFPRHYYFVLTRVVLIIFLDNTGSPPSFLPILVLQYNHLVFLVLSNACSRIAVVSSVSLSATQPCRRSSCSASSTLMIILEPCVTAA